VTEKLAVVGAGPYGLSIAAHLRHRGIPFRIFGPPMDTWLRHMPKGMLLKSDGFASNLYDPEGRLTLKQFCADRGIEYADLGRPVGLETFCTYGLTFQKQFVPELENKLAVGVERTEGGFLVSLDDGEKFATHGVVLAVGITHFEYVPPALAKLPAQLLSHSAHHHDLSQFKDRNVVVLGGGASALDMAGLLHEAGAQVQLVARRQELKFHTKPTGKPRSAWQQIRHPKSGLGPGLRTRFYADAPGMFHYLPEKLRLKIVKRTLGPAGGYFVRDMVVGKVPLLVGCQLENVTVEKDLASLHLRTPDGSTKQVVTEHVIAATGYQVNLDSLRFLSQDLRHAIRTLHGSPILSTNLESSVPGLYFAGIAAANSFGPVMRFAFGAGFSARRLTQALSA
jgi:cation diffusion facilitator CzcD-associated flavoprotein CzcO